MGWGKIRDNIFILNKKWVDGNGGKLNAKGGSRKHQNEQSKLNNGKFVHTLAQCGQP
jgi:hypothetical protein